MILKIFQAVYSKHNGFCVMVKKWLLVMILLWPFHASVASDVYSHRIAQFKANKQAMQNIAQALAYDDFEAIADAANQIEVWGRPWRGIFPKDQTKPHHRHWMRFGSSLKHSPRPLTLILRLPKGFRILPLMKTAANYPKPCVIYPPVAKPAINPFGIEQTIPTYNAYFWRKVGSRSPF